MGGEKYNSKLGDGVGVVGMGCGGVVGYDVYYRCFKGAVVRLISCNAPLKASRMLWVNILNTNTNGQNPNGQNVHFYRMEWPTRG